MTLRKITLAVTLVLATFGLQACSTGQVVDNTVNGAGYVAKTAAKGAIGAGKLVVKGAQYASQ